MKKQQQLQKFFCAYLRELEKNWFNCLLSLNKYIFKSLSVLNVPPFVTLLVYFDCALQNDVFLIDWYLGKRVTLRIVDRGAEVFNSLSIKVSRLCSHRIQTWDSSLNWNTVLIYTDNKTHFKTFPMFFFHSGKPFNEVRKMCSGTNSYN